MSEAGEAVRDNLQPGGTSGGGSEHRIDAPVRIKLRHRTRYLYERPTWLSAQEIRLRPAPHARTPVPAYTLRIAPENHDLKWLQDPHGNWVGRVLFTSAVAELVIDVELEARLVPINPFDFYVDDSAWQFPFAYSASDRRALAPYLDLEPAGDRLSAWIERMRGRLLGRPLDTVELLVAVNRWVADDIRYVRRMQPGTQSAERTLAAACGSCRDSAWLLAQVLRHIGIATRFVSGYLIQLADGLRQRGIDEDGDHAALHAWCEAYLPGAGWVGLDATSGLLAAEGHLPLACTALPADAAAVSGYAQTSSSRLAVDMQVTRLASGTSLPFAR